MREILFKAKRLDNGEWVEGNLITNERNENQKYIGYIFDERNGVIEDFDIVEVIPDTLCQFTGLNDCTKWESLAENERELFLSEWNYKENRKNEPQDWKGRKIWENDIVSNEWCFLRGKSIVKFGEYKDYHMPERYQCGNYGFFLEHMHQNDFGARKDILYFSCKCEVVGNIFDNPELLQEVE